LIDSALYSELKRRAAAEGRTLTEVVERALRLGLHGEVAHRRARVVLPSYDLGPFRVDPADRARFSELGGAPAPSEEGE